MTAQALRRVDEQLESYWQAISAGRDFPSEREISPEALKDIWNDCFMVRYEGGEGEQAEFRYIYLGQSLVEAYGDDLSNKEVCEKLAYPHNRELVAQFWQVVTSRVPHRVEDEFTNSNGLIIKYRSCLLPLAKDVPGEVGYVLGGMRWKAL